MAGSLQQRTRDGGFHALLLESAQCFADGTTGVIEKNRVTVSFEVAAADRQRFGPADGGFVNDAEAHEGSMMLLSPAQAQFDGCGTIS